MRGGGGHSGTEGGRNCVTYFAEEGGTPHVRDFVKERYFFVPRYKVWVVEIPLQSTKYTQL